jgi:NAD(P)-dependent dehydrogenase (short-subunit alcohol dehydrogenase family)
LNEVVFITGASSGFGRLAAETLAGKGYRVVATMREASGKNAGHRGALELTKRQSQAALDVLELDVTRDDSVQRAVAHALDLHGRIDVVINNAGVAAMGVTEAFTVEQFQGVFDINVWGALRVNRAVLPAMRREGQGLLIHVSSVAGRVTVPYMAAYCASKSALETVADAFHFELRPFGIESVVVEPGMYRTPIFDKVQHASDRLRLEEQPASVERAARVEQVFRASITHAAAPGAEEVVQALENLIRLPRGQRPFRTVVGQTAQPLLEAINQASDDLRPIVAQAFQVPELVEAWPGASTDSTPSAA